MGCWWDWPYVWVCTRVFLDLYFSKWQDIHFCGSSLFPPKHGTVLGIGSTAVSVTLSKVVGYMCACSVTQSCPTLCCPLDCSLPGSCIHAIFMARILEWVAISPSRGPSQSRDWNRDSCVSCIAGRFFTSEPPGKPKVVGPWITHMYKWSLCI